MNSARSMPHFMYARGIGDKRSTMKSNGGRCVGEDISCFKRRALGNSTEGICFRFLRRPLKQIESLVRNSLGTSFLGRSVLKPLLLLRDKVKVWQTKQNVKERIRVSHSGQCALGSHGLRAAI